MVTPFMQTKQKLLNLPLELIGNVSKIGPTFNFEK